jgi:hypothetical protein
VVSPAFLQKKWPETELHALMTRRIEDKLKLLPIWHNVGRVQVASFSPMLADLVALQTAGRTAQDLALALLAEILTYTSRRDLPNWKSSPLARPLRSLRKNCRTFEIKYPSCSALPVKRRLSNGLSPTTTEILIKWTWMSSSADT